MINTAMKNQNIHTHCKFMYSIYIFLFYSHYIHSQFIRSTFSMKLFTNNYSFENQKKYN